MLATNPRIVSNILQDNFKTFLDRDKYSYWTRPKTKWTRPNTKMVIPVTTKTNIKVLFQNNYSNNSFTFEGPLPNREFIVTPL